MLKEKNFVNNIKSLEASTQTGAKAEKKFSKKFVIFALILTIFKHFCRLFFNLFSLKKQPELRWFPFGDFGRGIPCQFF